MAISHFLVLIASLAIGSAAIGQEAYLPLAGAKVSLEPGHAEDFSRVVEKFAEQGHFQFERGDFPKQGRTVANFRIRITDKTFPIGSNFRDLNVYELAAYSHESTSTWQVPWHDLVLALESEFGPKSVVSIEPH